MAATFPPNSMQWMKQRFLAGEDLSAYFPRDKLSMASNATPKEKAEHFMMLWYAYVSKGSELSERIKQDFARAKATH